MLAPVLLLLSPLIYSYAHWMLRASSLPFGVRSVEWVRADVPFGNQLVDEVEHVYYSWNAPKKGGPQLKSLPATGHATLRWSGESVGIRPDVEAALPGALVAHAGAKNSVAGWLFPAAVSILGIMLLWLVVLIYVVMTTAKG